MGFFQAIKCRTGFHTWGDWSPKKSNDCTQRRACSACSKNETQTYHDWTSFEYKDPTSCAKESFCRHCRQRQAIRTVHDWRGADWDFVDAANSCDQTRTCPRCQEKSTRQVHAWAEWKFESPQSKRLIRFCRRCKDGSEIKEPYHIISMPNRDIGYVLIVGQLLNTWAPRDAGEQAMRLAVVNMTIMGEQYGCRAEEVGQVPVSPRTDRNYYTWEWREQDQKSTPLWWNGHAWQ